MFLALCKPISREHHFLLDIQILNVFGVSLDEFSAWQDIGTHQDIEDIIGLFSVFGSYLKQYPIFRIHSRLP